MQLPPSKNGNGKPSLAELGAPAWAVAWCLEIEGRVDRLEKISGDSGAKAGAQAGRRWGATLGAFAVAFATTLSTCQQQPSNNQPSLPTSCERPLK